MTKNNDDTERKKFCTWCIHDFDRKLKDKFVGLAKTEGQKVKNFLTYAISKFLREEKKND